MLLGSIHLDLRDPSGIHYGQVGSQPATDLLVGTGRLLCQSLQRQQHLLRDRWTPTPRRGGATFKLSPSAHENPGRLAWLLERPLPALTPGHQATQAV
jgi:hypothetical protein